MPYIVLHQARCFKQVLERMTDQERDLTFQIFAGKPPSAGAILGSLQQQRAKQMSLLPGE